MTRCWLAILAGFLLPPAALAGGACVSIPEGSSEPPVTACELGDEYAFDIVGDKLRYDKRTYRLRLREAVAGWLATHGLDDALLTDAKVDVFFAVPEVDPAATQARMQVRLRDGRAFVVFLSPRMEDWSPGDADVGVLPRGQTYPEHFGDRAATVLIEKVPGSDPRSFRESLAGHGVHDAEPFSGNWWSGGVDALKESEVAERLIRSPFARPYVARAQANPLVEWIAERRRVFAFSWESP